MVWELWTENILLCLTSIFAKNEMMKKVRQSSIYRAQKTCKLSSRHFYKHLKCAKTENRQNDLQDDNLGSATVGF